MGKGRDIARAADTTAPHHNLLEDMRDQLVIAFLKRLADKDGCFDIPVAEVDATGGVLVAFSVNQTVSGPLFHFEIRKKQ